MAAPDGRADRDAARPPSDAAAVVDDHGSDPAASMFGRLRERMGFSRSADPDDPAAETDTVFPPAPNDRPGWHVRLFGSREFFRLWIVQVVSATGDWLGFTAIIAFTNQLYAQDPGAAAAAISVVMLVRIIPHLFFSPLAGVLVDRWDRKKTMIVADLARAGMFAVLPFVKSLWGLLLFSLLIEMFTLLWTPSKEAITPHLVPHDHLTTASSLNLAAGYGPALFAPLLFAALAGLSAWLGNFSALSFLGLNQTALAFLVNAVTFIVSAFLVYRLAMPDRARHARDPREIHGDKRVDLNQTFHELKEGWHYVFLNPTVRAVNVSLGIALVGGGMLITLGAVFASDVLKAGPAGFGLFTTSLIFGAVIGVAGVSALQRRIPKQSAFPIALFVAGGALFLAASVDSLGAALAFVFVMGLSVGPAYALGYSILHEQVDDELRGRVFSALNTLVRFCLIISWVIGPLLIAFFDGVVSALLDERAVTVGDVSYFTPGVRITLWVDAAIIAVAGLLARHSLRAANAAQQASVAGHPANGASATANGQDGS